MTRNTETFLQELKDVLDKANSEASSRGDSSRGASSRNSQDFLRDLLRNEGEHNTESTETPPRTQSGINKPKSPVSSSETNQARERVVDSGQVIVEANPSGTNPKKNQHSQNAERLVSGLSTGKSRKVGERLKWGSKNFPDFLRITGDNLSYLIWCYFEIARVHAVSAKEAKIGMKAKNELFRRVIKGIKVAQGGRNLATITGSESDVVRDAAKRVILLTEINDLLKLLEHTIYHLNDIKDKFGISLGVQLQRNVNLADCLQRSNIESKVREESVETQGNQNLDREGYSITLPAIDYTSEEEGDNQANSGAISKIFARMTGKKVSRNNKALIDYYKEYLDSLSEEELKTLVIHLIDLNKNYVETMIEALTKASGWNWAQEEDKESKTGVSYNNVKWMRFQLKIFRRRKYLENPYKAYSEEILEKAFESYKKLLEEL